MEQASFFYSIDNGLLLPSVFIRLSNSFLWYGPNWEISFSNKFPNDRPWTRGEPVTKKGL
jgi:hypothetical protein